MYIKTIVIDGFKSYGTRVEINGFDEEFNAITGLNGTGKSNILDSICFVLGISNLGHVRAGSLQDLIYKSGQAGIHKATVSITFNNSSKEQCPPGYEDEKEIIVTRQIVMGGKNKYWINGLVVPNKKVQDLFCSVQLNVNNPHFLIMQGRVTKVLNMKPHEILAMVEEAAGTRMYEAKRQSAQKMIDKKDSKLGELNTILQEEISPKLNKLREERQSYMEFLRIERELEHMNLLYQAWLFYATQKASQKAEKKMIDSVKKVEDLGNAIEQNKVIIEEVTNEIQTMSKADAESSIMEELKDTVKQTEKKEAICSAKVKGNEENVSSLKKTIKELEKNLKEEEASLINKEQELTSFQTIFKNLKEDDEEDEANFLLSQKKFNTISAGMEVNDKGEEQSLNDQLNCARNEAIEAVAENEKLSAELKENQEQLKEKERRLGSNTQDSRKEQAVVDRLQNEVKAIEHSLNKLNYSEQEMNELNENRRKLSHENDMLRDKIERFKAGRPHTGFSYSKPQPNFNAAKVFGVACNLFTVKESKYCTALETAAGGKLYNVVVDNDQTSKALLQNGQLQYRTTFIPLNKIQAGKLAKPVIKAAQDLVGKENVVPAIDLITFDPRVEPAMNFMFGNVFICKDINIAKQVTFDNRIRKKCVTLDGDVTDPGGVLSGGASHKGAPILLQIDDILQSERALKQKENEFTKVGIEMEKLIRKQEQSMLFRNQLEIKHAEAKAAQQLLDHAQRYGNEVEELKKTIVTIKNRILECKKIIQNSNEKVKDLESRTKDTKSYRDKQLKNAEKEMSNFKTKWAKSKNEWEKHEQQYSVLTLQITESKKAIENGQKQIEENLASIDKTKEEATELIASLETIRVELAEIKKELEIKKAAVQSKNKEIQTKKKKKEQLSAKNEEILLKIKKEEHEVKKLREDYEKAKLQEIQCAKNIKSKDDKHLRDAKELSDQEGQDLHNKITRAQDKRQKLSRLVNAKAQSMFEHEEKQYTSLKKKIGIVEIDRNKLIMVMKDLDKKKKEALLLAHTQVRKDFGSIFSTLLPGADATLQIPEGRTILEGLEVRVSLGGQWKESLSELSGGQRSLVALSLILAMLLFKPAPLYILDEVDAALDLSHTQNIGNMLKSHFRQSQFIIVSLKDGMFNNANVLFRTKFIDGMSNVSRTVNRR